MKAILRNYRISPAKANLVAELVRGKKAIDAIDILKFTTKKAARPLMKLIESALANGVNNFKQDRNDLYIKEIIVNTGPTLKRSIPVSRGRSNPIMKRTTHMTVKLAVEEKNTTKPKVSKKIHAKETSKEQTK